MVSWVEGKFGNTLDQLGTSREREKIRPISKPGARNGLRRKVRIENRKRVGGSKSSLLHHNGERGLVVGRNSFRILRDQKSGIEGKIVEIRATRIFDIGHTELWEKDHRKSWSGTQPCDGKPKKKLVITIQNRP